MNVARTAHKTDLTDENFYNFWIHLHTMIVRECVTVNKTRLPSTRWQRQFFNITKYMIFLWSENGFDIFIVDFIIRHWVWEYSVCMRPFGYRICSRPKTWPLASTFHTSWRRRFKSSTEYLWRFLNTLAFVKINFGRKFHAAFSIFGWISFAIECAHHQFFQLLKMMARFSFSLKNLFTFRHVLESLILKQNCFIYFYFTDELTKNGLTATWKTTENQHFCIRQYRIFSV